MDYHCLLTDPGVIFYEIHEGPRTPTAEVGAASRRIDGMREITTTKQSTIQPFSHSVCLQEGLAVHLVQERARKFHRHHGRVMIAPPVIISSSVSNIVDCTLVNSMD